MTFPTEFLHNLPREFLGEVRTDPYSRLLYSTDASIYQIEPLAVVFPHTREDVQMVVSACARECVPILARGAGSALAGQAVGRAVVLDFSRHLNRVLEVNAEERWARVEPGVVCDLLNNHLQPYGLQYGTDPASANRATLGGIVGNNSTGAHSLLYGMTADHVLEADVVLSDGSTARFAAQPYDAPLPAGDSFAARLHREVADIAAHNAAAIRASYPRTWRNSSGYRLNYLLPEGGYVATRPSGWLQAQYPVVNGFNLAQLMAGSEGTLAVLNEIKVDLVPRPPRTVLGILQFDSIAAACDATPTILETEPSAVELIDDMIIRLTRNVPAYNRMLTFVEGIPAAVLIVEYYGATDAELLAKLDRLEARIAGMDSSARPGRVSHAVSAAEQGRVWGVRKVGLGLLMSVKGDAKPIPFIEDAAVPVQSLGDYVRAVERLFAEHGVSAGIYAHASAGCLHIRPLINTKSRPQIETMHAIARSVLELMAKMGGAMTGEHGDGLARSAFNKPLFGEEVYQAFCDVKRA
ncbi:MAG: FAD-binding oxidoreductase, partial [Anaerolineales bacterium]